MHKLLLYSRDHDMYDVEGKTDEKKKQRGNTPQELKNISKARSREQTEHELDE